MNPYRLARPILYQFDAETTHDQVMAGLERLSGVPRLLDAVDRLERFDDPRLRVTLFGHQLDSPLAIAAGLDKNGVAVPAFDALGFSYVEVGTVTLMPQPGREKPRVFRLPPNRALINRMGFPSRGADAVAANLRRARGRGRFALNIGPNKDRVDHAAGDSLAVIAKMTELNPIYMVVNVSSPNTAHLRDLQGKAALRHLLSQVLDGRPPSAMSIPVLVKIAPDLTEHELDDILQVVTDLGLPGIVATNTTLVRPDGLHGEVAAEQGGLSGLPLRDRSTRIIARIHEQTAGALTIIGVGGVFSGADVLDKVGAGASVVQVYTGLIYEGPGMAKRAKREMVHILDREGIASLDAIRGTGYRAPRC